MAQPIGRHFLHVPGPTNVPDRVLRAMSAPTIDHRGPEFAALAAEVLAGLRPLFGTTGPVVVHPSSGTGAWEAALVNTLSPGDRVLAFETGHFAALWREMAEKLGLRVDFVPGDWRHGIDPEVVRERLAADPDGEIRAVCAVHNETSTGVTSRIAEVRRALDAVGHPALLLVDTISSLGSVDYRHDEWGVDVTIACSQKGLMLPPGLGFNAISAKALRATESARLPRSYWDWRPQLAANERGFFPSTPATNLLFGLREALVMLDEEGLPAVFRRHLRHAAATRAAVRGWGLEVLCLDEREHSPALTAVLLPDGHDADEFRRVVLERCNTSLGAGLGKLAGRVFRIGHLGHLNDVGLAAALSGVQLGLAAAGVPFDERGITAALAELGEA
ncbi:MULTISPECIES: alanine--glyoxylate aminotransferase family protein [unclassified Saccharopolyspora]|uniref:pyridoxal-phosphate-dependent aminotransferase family protein n=1 Tax=unclassified Saccharopolyspora TaxID=2646250 RepID=UPI001CD66BD5|nr:MULTISPECIES: aminotransferase class V-fold PLP-dependent enzyme [unclassified Saccharopolyspora]MCA1185321.1 aminotransferase class V-fold PLP-dependent enzyme [Saccharopolyspora sp. 6T]MCA1224662.1 aminotransferase class V-fold PLP-dependent enzyme [Saccharopolyspora sp. 6M]MCA1279412.1 aminotransferase class V-fold PLP-dependent enzyme [Saccharopolyspora sp. 7B]